MNALTFINDFVFATIEGAVILSLLIMLSGKRGFMKQLKLKTLLWLVAYVAFANWIKLVVPQGIHTIFISLFVIVVLSLIANINLYVSSICALAALAIFALSETTVVMIATVLFKVTLNYILSDPVAEFLFSFIAQVLNITVVAIISRFNFDIMKFSLFQNRGWGATFVSLQFFLGAVFVMMTMNKDAPFYMYLFPIGIIITILSISHIEIRDTYRTNIIENKMHLQEEYIKSLETVVDIIRKEKHDYLNHLNTIQALCSVGESTALDDIREYICKLTGDRTHKYSFYNTGNRYVDALLAVKSSIAERMDICFDVDLDAALDCLDISDIDLTGILSNIIDNAFDAVASRADAEKKIVALYTYMQDGKFYISISNNGPCISEKDLSRIFERGFSTKKVKKPEEHGLGLVIVKNLVDANKGNVTVTSNQDETEFLLEFNVNRSAVPNFA